MNLRVRLHKPEQLDNLSLSGGILDTTLASLKFINTYFGNHRQLSKAILHYCITHPTIEKIHIVDIGCGGGDCIAHISETLKKHNMKATFTGIDGNPKSISYAQQNNPDPTHISFNAANILDKDFALPNCDLLISSHFIYHFNNEHLIYFLKKLQSNTVKHIIFSELYRSKMAYHMFKTIRFMLPVSDMAKKDGLIAIQRAFTNKELETIIRKSTIEKHSITKKPFFRMIAQIYLHNEKNTV
ncbi:methyltransferase domain-containing protein [Aquimarina macrocephali]|uniref:methyltransferase domain-containing protein n=1 Tax=Aquimarina macrocephali TaxID=666563 RepID=UPI00046683BF|nr:methyltransferase domain-containing protein [Aquimarina macrocephali]